MTTERSPAATRPAALARLTTPRPWPISVAATTNGSEVVDCSTPAIPLDDGRREQERGDPGTQHQAGLGPGEGISGWIAGQHRHAGRRHARCREHRRAAP